MPSTVLRDLSYDPASRRLWVTFVPTGRRYVYADVPPEAWEGLRRAFSKGAHFNRHIRGHYPAERLEAGSGPTSSTMP